MNKQTIQTMWEQFRLIHGVTLRGIAKIPEKQLDEHPIPEMRTPKELVVHMYAYMRAIPAAVVKGGLTADDCAEPVDRIGGREELIRYAKESFEKAAEAVEKVNDAHLGKEVPTHFGQPFPGSYMFTILYDETLHHRGQLWTYLRAMGVEPPFLWSFDENEPAFRPKAATA